MSWSFRSGVDLSLWSCDGARRKRVSAHPLSCLMLVLIIQCRVGEAAEEEGTALTGAEWAYMITADAILLCFAALFAGLTLALMSLDTLSLEIMADSGVDPEKTYAAKILPIRKLGNQLLCTLILGNVMVNTLIAQITDSNIHGWVATVVSTALTTLGGEVLPQALMSAHALQVGSKSAMIVQFFIILFFPICKPLSILLDRVVGTDPGQIYERNELKKLMLVHASRSAETGLASGEAELMVGAMELHEKTVMDVMTPVEQVLMLEANEPVTEDLLQLISDRGHSRIPVYQSDKNNVVGLLFAKDLLMVDPQEGTRVLLLMKFYNRRCYVVPSETKLISMLQYFQSGRSHVALIRELQERSHGDPFYEVKGLVSLEDVIEELIHGKIFDEHDTGPTPVDQLFGGVFAPPTATPHHTPLLPFPHARSILLSPNELKAAALFLLQSIPELTVFKQQPDHVLVRGLSLYASCYKVRAPTAARGHFVDSDANVWLYRKDVPANVFTLVISGCVEVFSTKELLSLEFSTWSTLASGALTTTPYVPSFSCRIVEDSTILQISREGYDALLSTGLQSGVGES